MLEQERPERTCARFVKFRESAAEPPGTGSEDFIKIETRHLCWKLPIRRKPAANTRSDTLEFLLRRRPTVLLAPRSTLLRFAFLVSRLNENTGL